jgi:cytochrome c peroxidase
MSVLPSPLGGLPPLGPLATTARVQVKVPLGLDAPAARDLPPANPPTLARWKLGKQLFFDDGYLNGSRKVSCAGCHVPANGFTAGKDRDARIAGMDTPTLLNVVYNGRQFWDGRAGSLEEVVQRGLDDEREAPPPGADRRHVWGGVVKRLRGRPPYNERFKEAFGTLPTQDAVGKALATYLRTLLAGNSVYDRAQAQHGGANLEWADFQKALGPPALAVLDRDPSARDDVAKELHRGYQLFFDLGERKAGCVRCHGGRTFSDGEFHNLGVGVSGDRQHPTGKEPGRFAHVPPGQKDRRLIGAFKTPTLRGLPRTGPYFHDGSAETVRDAVRAHLKDGAAPFYLDDALRDPQDPTHWRKHGLDDKDVDALVLFLQALNGELPPPVVTEPPSGPTR